MERWQQDAAIRRCRSQWLEPPDEEEEEVKDCGNRESECERAPCSRCGYAVSWWDEE